MARRSFSLMLAWRYLNPRRAMLSAVTIISVTGVLLGVWILVVVMSVFNGLEQEVQKRLLGYTPHIRLTYHGMEPPEDWRVVSKSIAAEPGVKSTAPFLQDYALVDISGGIRPPSQATFRAVDTSNADQVKALEEMLDRTDYPEGSADMGLDKKVVISDFIAKPLGVGIGDKIRLYSARNFEQVKTAFEISDQPLVRDRYKDTFDAAKSALAGHFAKQGEQILMPDEAYGKLVDFSDLIMADRSNIREEEVAVLDQFIGLLDQVDRVPGGKLMAPETPGEALGFLKQLDGTDRDKMDNKITKRIRELVLPQEAEVIGIFQPGQMAVMPEIFMPLPLAQQISGLDGSAVQAVAVRLDNSYDAKRISEELIAKLPEGWEARTWYDDFGDFARLINQQRVMMYIVLSMIIVISAFSMMAVMFTVTIQKRREIGVMKALGAAPGQIVRVFLHQGIILGAVGAVLGVGLGILTLRLRGNLQDFLRVAFHFDPFPANFNGFNVLPAHMVPMEVVLIAVSAFILCSLAAMVPAIFASRSDAAKSLRNL